MLRIDPKIPGSYARELLPLGHGYALWQADPDERDKDGRQVTLGDVGYLENGRFHPLFNTRISGHDFRLEALHGTPEGFRHLPESQLSVVRRNEGEDQAPIMCNKGLSNAMDIENESELIEKMDGESYELRFLRPPVVGAILLFVKPLETEQLCKKLDSYNETSQQTKTQTAGQSKKPELKTDKMIASYMSQSRKAWYAFTQSLPYLRHLAEEDLMLISGTAKTWRWASMAYERERGDYMLRQLVLRGSSSLDRESVGFHAAGEYFNDMSMNCGSSVKVELPDGTLGDGPRNQCNFIHYYKFKRSCKWPRVIKAAAGPHQLPRRGPDGDSAAPAVAAIHESSGSGDGAVDSGSREKRPIEKAYDPVTPVLDYIIEHSAAKTAVASTLDLMALFEIYGYSSDIRALLERVKPVIELDEDGVGIIGAFEPHVNTAKSARGDVKNVYACAQDVRSLAIHCPRVAIAV
ncbi:hypothetical protein C8Q80DRAFT_958613 [Daedaleopsis nitida]|nr:hypothetical protein C8Q80DRAFT_958613 [Daedaleopsis nitida]